MCRSNLKATLELDTKVIFAYPQKDGSLLIHVEEYDESTAPPKKKG